MNIRKLVGRPNFLVLSIALLILGVIALFSPSAQQSTRPDASKSVAKLFKQKPSKKHSSSPVVAQALLTPSPSQTTTLPVVHKSGTLTANETWTTGSVYVIDNTFEVGNGTLTIESGVIIKLTSMDSYQGIVVNGGTLNVVGTTTDPVIFTSIQDDSVGGDSANDGPTTGSHGDYATAVNFYSGTTNISYALMRYGNKSVAAEFSSSTPHLQIRDSDIQSTLGIKSCPIGTIDLRRNDINPHAGLAVYAQYSTPIGIILDGADMNHFNGQNAGRTIYLNDIGTIPSGESWSINGQSGAVLITAQQLYVDGQLSVSHGAILKASLVVSGTLNAVGSSTEPITFTTLSDDSVGGDNDNGGVSTGNENTFMASMRSVQGSTITVSHAVFQYSGSALVSGTYSNSGCSSGAVSITDSTLKSNISYSGCGSFGPLNLARNTFDISSVYAIQAGHINPSGIILAGSDKNVFVGDAKGKVVYIFNGPGGPNSVNTGESWAISSEGNATLIVQGTIYNDGTIQALPGARIKVNNTIAFQNENNGALDFQGTAGNPVVITSSRDDTLGGNTDAPDDYATIAQNYIAFQQNNGSMTLQNVQILYPDTALNMYGGQATVTGALIAHGTYGFRVTDGNAVVRASFANASSYAIQACNWTSANCSVDASYSDWGSAGPTTSLVCGQVTVAPWKNGSTTVNGGLFASSNCNGSTPTPDVQLNTAATHYASRMSSKEIDCSGGFQDACQAMQTAQQCLSAATSLAASTSSFPLPSGNAYDQPAQWGGMLADNASAYIQSQEGEIPILSAASFATQLLGAVQTIMNVANAYNTCAP